MSKDKYDFIQDLLESTKLSTTQRERILMLTKEEIKKDSIYGRNLDDRINKLEEILKINGNKLKNNTFIEGSNYLNEQNLDLNSEFIDDSTESKFQEKYTNPFHLYKYLLFYNQNSILKSTCHEIDRDELEIINSYCETESYSYEKHLEKIIEEFNRHNKKNRAPKQIMALIRAYLTGKRRKGESLVGWSMQNIQVNWSCDELQNWCRNNPGIPPNLDGGLRRQIRNSGFELNPNLKLRDGVVIQKFSDLVIHFKHLFHIRGDNSLKKIIKKQNEYNNWGNEINFEIDDANFPSNIEFFTDVDKLVQAYKTIINLIIEVKEDNSTKATVKLSLHEKEDKIRFVILHRNSIYKKTVQNTIERLGNTYSKLITKQINGVCNLYIKADFENNYSYEIGIWNKINLWKSELPEAIKLDYKVGGTEHIFEIIKFRNN